VNAREGSQRKSSDGRLSQELRQGEGIGRWCEGESIKNMPTGTVLTPKRGNGLDQIFKPRRCRIYRVVRVGVVYSSTPHQT
jgi:hypothetical protein